MNKKHLYIGRITIIYGLLYVLLDGINFLLTQKINDFYLYYFPLDFIGVPYVSPENRFVNWVFIIVLINAGYFIIKKDKNSWFLYNIALIGLICKEVAFLIFGWNLIPGTSGSITFIVSIIGFVYLNLVYFEQRWNNNWSRNILKLFIIFLINSIFVLSFTINQDYNSDKYYLKGLINASTYNHPNSKDTCLFANEFIQVLDTIDPNDRIKTIKIVELHSDLEPKYSETISRYSFNVVSEDYFYDSNRKLTKIVSEGFHENRFVNTYEYYENGLLKNEIKNSDFDGFQSEQIKCYVYIKEGDTIFASNTNNVNYTIIMELNEINKIKHAIHKKFDFPISEVNYFYDKSGTLIELHGYNAVNEILFIEKFNYSGDKLKSKEKCNYFSCFDFDSYARPSKGCIYKELTIYKD